MRRLLLVAAAFIFCRQAVAQDSFSLDDYKSLKFYGIDFAPAQVVGAEEGASSRLSEASIRSSSRNLKNILIRSRNI